MEELRAAAAQESLNWSPVEAEDEESAGVSRAVPRERRPKQNASSSILEQRK